jgi:tRNA pseudouridine38-40 synthase
MRYLIEVSYIGTNYCGWQIQPNANTVQEELEKVLSKVLNNNVRIQGSSRTDTGVHAKQQFAHFDSNAKIKDLVSIGKRANKLLPKDIAIKNIWQVPVDYNSRFDALNRKYIYRISKAKNPFNFAITAQYYHDFDVNLMNEAAETLLNHEDFESFSKVKTDVKTFNCNISEAKWIQNEEVLEFHIKANRFLRGMVRAIVGTLLDVGKGKITKADFEEIIKKKNRNLAGMAAKEEGLTLEEVNYSKEYCNIQITLDKINDNDLPVIRELFLAYQDYLGISLCFQSFDKELMDLPQPYHEPNGCIIKAMHNGEIVGVVALKPLSEQISEIKRLFVKPAYHGFGIGRMLLEKVMNEANLKNYKKIRLDTLERLEAAVALYRKYGFEEIAPYNFNPENDIIYFEKELK